MPASNERDLEWSGRSSRQLDLQGEWFPGGEAVNTDHVGIWEWKGAGVVVWGEGWMKELREGDKETGQVARNRAVLPPCEFGAIYTYYIQKSNF